MGLLNIILKLLLFLCMIAYTYTDEFEDQHFQPGSVSHNNLSHQNYAECPMWFNHNSVKNDCQCLPFFPLKCDGIGQYMYASVKSEQLLTYDSHRGLISAISMRHKYLGGYNVTKVGYTMLPNDILELNEYMCGPLNRKDYLCSECRSGYGPAAFLKSCTNVCYLCQNTWYDIVLYLSLEFVAITIFYLLILIFQIKLISPPMTYFILYSQLIVLAFYEECNKESISVFSQVKFKSTGDLRRETKIILTFYGIFNLDFFHYVVSPFCISSQLKPIHIIFLGYISAFYPFLLIILTWLCVELHSRNFRPIVCLWRPFHRCFVRLRRGWNSKSDLIDVFSSFFLLSYSKVMYQIVLIVCSELITSYSLIDGRESEEYVLSADTSITRKNTKYFSIIIATVLLAFTFNIIPVLLLLLYPTTIFQRLLTNYSSNRFQIILNTFVEKFQSCYKNRLDTAVDRRSFSGLYFLLMIITFFIEEINRQTFKCETWFMRGFILSVTALLVALSRPYKKTFLNTVDSILLSHLATLCYIASTNKSWLYLQFLQIAIIFSFVVFCMLIVYRMAHGLCKAQFQWLSLHYLKSSRVRAYDTSVIPYNSSQQQIAQTKATYGTISLF